jgi:hypothetical protein
LQFAKEEKGREDVFGAEAPQQRKKRGKTMINKCKKENRTEPERWNQGN